MTWSVCRAKATASAHRECQPGVITELEFFGDSPVPHMRDETIADTFLGRGELAVFCRCVKVRQEFLHGLTWKLRTLFEETALVNDIETRLEVFVELLHHLAPFHSPAIRRNSGYLSQR